MNHKDMREYFNYYTENINITKLAKKVNKLCKTKFNII